MTCIAGSDGSTIASASKAPPMGRNNVCIVSHRLSSHMTLSAKNSTVKLNSTAVYYAESYGADAEVIATLLGVPITNIAPMPTDPGVPIDSASVVVILGSDTTV